MKADHIKSISLFLYLWLPSLAALSTTQVQDFGEAFAVAFFSLFVLLCPLVLLGRIRRFFLFWTPLVPLVLPYVYLTFFYHSVPSDALVSAAIHQDVARSVEVLLSFGWKVWLIPASVIGYLLVVRSIDAEVGLSNHARKKLLASLLMFVMLSMVSRQALALMVRVPPCIEDYTTALTFPTNLFYSISRSMGRDRAISPASVHGHALSNTQPLIVVLVVGESVRADHLGLSGYVRNTTPLLSALGPDLIAFSDVSSTANYTNASVTHLVTLPTTEGKATLVQTFKEANFTTAWLSNQESEWYGKAADVLDYSSSSLDFHLRKDVCLLPLFASFVHQGGAKQFVVLHMDGSHAPYEERYGADSHIFRPTLTDIGIHGSPLPENKVATINSYDNTIVEMDRFLAKVISILSSNEVPTIMVYTSDHGENLFDDERGLFLHAQSEPTRYDTHVPLLIWANASYQSAFPSTMSALRANQKKRISHTSVFPTLLALGGVGWNGQSPRDNLASAEFKENVRLTQGGNGVPREYDHLR